MRGLKLNDSFVFLQRITFLNVANNPKLGQNGIEEIKKTVHRLGVENLNIASCMLGNVIFEREVS